MTKFKMTFLIAVLLNEGYSWCRFGLNHFIISSAFKNLKYKSYGTENYKDASIQKHTPFRLIPNHIITGNSLSMSTHKTF